MKRQLAIISVSAIAALMLTSCSGHRIDDPVRHFVKSEPEETEPLHREPSHDLSSVEATQTFEDFYVDDFDVAWGQQQKLKMAKGSVQNEFIYIVYDSQRNVVNENLNNMTTISTPTIFAYPAEEEGYVIYEITYTQTVPIASIEPQFGTSSMCGFDTVFFLDYYTGYTYPALNMAGRDSFCVTGNVIYDGETYNVSFYKFRDYELLEDEVTDNNDGTVLFKHSFRYTYTAYVIVPEGYHGIMMGVLLGDYSNITPDEAEELVASQYAEPKILSEEEDIDNYVFFLVSADS